MNARRPTTRTPRAARTSLPLTLGPLLLVAASSGCEGTIGPGGNGGDLAPVSTRDPQLDALSQSAELLSRVKNVFNAYCAECHSGRATEEGDVIADGDFDYIFDTDQMAATGIIKLGEPKESRLIRRVRDDSMPPRDYPFRPTEQDIKLLELWVSEGSPPIVAVAQRPQPTSSQLLTAMRADLETQPAPSRADVRYISLASLIANPSVADRELEAYENAVSKLVNSLSTTNAIVRPTPVTDPSGRTIALRVRLSDYGWGPSDWATIEQASELVDRVESKCDVAYLNADAFVAVASSDSVALNDGTTSSVYSNVILKNWLANRGVLAADQKVYADGKTTALGWGDIETGLGLNAAASITAGDGSVIRAGTAASGESAANRIVERYATSTGGYYWRSYDFGAFSRSNPLTDIFQTPIGPYGQLYRNGVLIEQADEPQFTPGGGAGFFRLPNGLQAYVVVDAQGHMMRAAAPDISADPLNIAGGRANDNGTSCLRCHIDGVAEVKDQVRDVVTKTKGARSNYAVGFVLTLHPPADELSAIINQDAERFREALRQTHAHGTASGPLPDGIGDLASLYWDFHDVESIASEFLVDTKRLQGVARDLVAEGDLRFQALTLDKGGLQRRTLKALYPKLRDALGLDDKFGKFCVEGLTAVEPPPEEPPPEEPPPEEPPPEEPPPEEPPAPTP
jgi:hypothetical protein